MIRTLVIATFAAAVLMAGPQNLLIDPVPTFTPFDVKTEKATWRGRRAIRVAEPTLNAGGGIAVLEGATLHNGVIEAEIAGQPAAGAVEGSRGFVGIAFRVQRDPLRYECFYLRPTNGRADDQVRRNHSAQYVSEPEFPWHRLRKEAPGMYESYVDLEPGAWTRVKILVEEQKARLFVHDAPQPVLIVNDLKLGDRAGGIGLFIGQGTEAYFSSLTLAAK